MTVSKATIKQILKFVSMSWRRGHLNVLILMNRRNDLEPGTSRGCGSPEIRGSCL